MLEARKLRESLYSNDEGEHQDLDHRGDQGTMSFSYIDHVAWTEGEKR